MEDRARGEVGRRGPGDLGRERPDELAAAGVVALGGLLLPARTLAALWVPALGFVLGGSFGLPLLAVRAGTPETAGEPSGGTRSAATSWPPSGRSRSGRSTT